jgi:hypothetical protein
VQRLFAAGVNDCAIARETGIPRCTVRDWRCRPQIRPRDWRASACNIHDFSGLPAHAYSYLLGLYLGDGCVSRSRRVWHLRITLDKKYPGIIGRCREAIDTLMSGQHAAIARQPTGCVVVSHYSKHWPCLLPQHGPGRKHLRPIRLEPWHEVLVKEATEEFVRGLIDSDGCRVVANDRWFGVSGTTSRTDPTTFADCSARRSMNLVFRGRDRAASKSPSIARPPSRDLTNSSDRKRDELRQPPRSTF